MSDEPKKRIFISTEGPDDDWVRRMFLQARAGGKQQLVEDMLDARLLVNVDYSQIEERLLAEYPKYWEEASTIVLDSFTGFSEYALADSRKDAFVKHYFGEFTISEVEDWHRKRKNDRSREDHGTLSGRFEHDPGRPRDHIREHRGPGIPGSRSVARPRTPSRRRGDY